MLTGITLLCYFFAHFVLLLTRFVGAYLLYQVAFKYLLLRLMKAYLVLYLSVQRSLVECELVLTVQTFFVQDTL